MKKIALIVILSLSVAALYSQETESKPVKRSSPVCNIKDLDLNLGFTGITYFHEIDGSYMILPDIGPIIRISKNLLGTEEVSYVDAGILVYANYAIFPQFDDTGFFVTGAAASIGFVNQAIVFSPGVSWVLNNSVNELTFSVIISNNSMKLTPNGESNT